MAQNLTISYLVASAVVLGAIGIFVWKRKKSFVRVGRIKKLLFIPVKSMKAIEVKKGKCSNLGFEVDGILERSFMLINESTKALISQRECPVLVLFSCRIERKTLIITAPEGDELKVIIKDSVAPDDVIFDCRIFTDSVPGVDCGDEAASFFQNRLKIPEVRLVRQFPSLPPRKYLKKDEFYKKLRKENPIAFQDLGTLHVLSQASIDELNSKLDGEQVSYLNFRPNILVEECKPNEEDSWQYVKFESGALLNNLILCTRCLLTTNDPSTAVLTKKEPLVTMRKYRIPKDKDMLEKTGSIPCFGLMFGVLKTGDISVGDDIFAVIGKQPAMQIK